MLETNGITARCQVRKDLPTYDYHQAVAAAEAQMDIGWLPTEPKVEKDLHCIKTELTPAALHGVMTALKLFTLYEIVAGNEYWLGRFKRMFPRQDFIRMAVAFGHTELNIHSPFYQRVDELLGLNTDEFYSSFTDDDTLRSRMDFLDSVVSGKDDLTSIAVFSMVEGSILYSSFAYLMHFQANGNNQLTNIHAGLTFSVKDENLHSEGGAWAFQTLLKEKMELGFTDRDHTNLMRRIYDAGDQIYAHECRIIDMIFAEGSQAGIEKEDLKLFVKHRINVCLQQLGMAPLFKAEKSVIEGWFYKMIGGDMQHDFFVKIGSSYNRNWSRQAFTYIKGGLQGRTWEQLNESV